MEQLRAELSHLLGERLSRIECVNEKADTTLWSLYDSQGNPVPLMARSFSTIGVARQLAEDYHVGSRRHCSYANYLWRDDSRRPSGPDVLLLERTDGVSVEAPTRTPERWQQLKEQIVEGLLAWHRR